MILPVCPGSYIGQSRLAIYRAKGLKKQQIYLYRLHNHTIYWHRDIKNVKKGGGGWGIGDRWWSVVSYSMATSLSTMGREGGRFSFKLSIKVQKRACALVDHLNNDLIMSVTRSVLFKHHAEYLHLDLKPSKFKRSYIVRMFNPIKHRKLNHFWS